MNTSYETSYKVKDIPCPNCGNNRVCVNAVILKCYNCGNFTELNRVIKDNKYIVVNADEIKKDATFC